MDEKPVAFAEFEEYLAQCGDEASRVAGLPKTESEFDDWWQRISVSDDLRLRWTRRIRAGEKFLEEITDQIEAIRRAA